MQKEFSSQWPQPSWTPSCRAGSGGRRLALRLPLGDLRAIRLGLHEARRRGGVAHAPWSSNVASLGSKK